MDLLTHLASIDEIQRTGVLTSSAGEPNRILAIYETKYDGFVFYMHVIVYGLDLMLVQAMDPFSGRIH